MSEQIDDVEELAIHVYLPTAALADREFTPDELADFTHQITREVVLNAVARWRERHEMSS